MFASILFTSFAYRLLSKNFKIKIHKTVILLVVLYGCETWNIRVRGRLEKTA
jgi:hypothetical protein